LKIVKFSFKGLKNFKGECSIIVPTPSINSRNFVELMVSCSKTSLPENNEIIVIISRQPEFNFSRSINRGLKLASFENILLLNDDCLFQSDTLLNAMKHKELTNSLIGSILLFPSGKIQHLGGYVELSFFKSFWKSSLALSPLFALRDFLTSKKYAKYYMRSFHRTSIGRGRIDYLTGAFLLFSKEILNRIGYFDENFKNGFEDLDFCLRSLEANYSLIVPTDVIAYHKEHQSLRHVKSNYYENLAYFTSKWPKKRVKTIINRREIN
jgi:GT2 family glycosyltransferase